MPMKLFAVSIGAYLASASLGVLGQVSPIAGEVGPWAQLGTAGVLAWVVSLLIGELRSSRADAARQREEHNVAWKVAGDRWHKEGEADRALMLRMVETCSANRRAAFVHEALMEDRIDAAKPK